MSNSSLKPNKNPFKPGDTVKCVNDDSADVFAEPHLRLVHGRQYEVAKAYHIGPEPFVDILLNEETSEGWKAERFEAVEEAPKASRPTIDFSGSSRQTARDYASLMPSRIIDEKHNKTLDRVRSGKPDVDALDLNEALLAVMRSATTRIGHSQGRREFAKKVAYLGHITQAVLENAIDGLPAYENGERSRLLAQRTSELWDARNEARRLKEELRQAAAGTQLGASPTEVTVLKQDLENARGTVRDLRQELSNVRQAASDERRRLVAEIDGLKQAADELRSVNSADRQRLVSSIDALTADRAKLQEESAKADAGVDNLLIILEYVNQFLTAEQKAQMTGFIDGLATEG